MPPPIVQFLSQLFDWFIGQIIFFLKNKKKSTKYQAPFVKFLKLIQSDFVLEGTWGTDYYSWSPLLGTIRTKKDKKLL